MRKWHVKPEVMIFIFQFIIHIDSFGSMFV